MGFVLLTPLEHSGASDSNATSPNHVGPGGTAYVGGVINTYGSSQFHFYRGDVDVAAQSFDVVTGIYGTTFPVASVEQSFTVDPNW